MQRMDVPHIIRQMLSVSGLNQGELATKLGTTQATVSRWLSGRHLPDFHQAQILERTAAEMGILSPNQNGLKTVIQIRVVGVVGLGETIEWAGDDSSLGEIELPFPVPEGCIALEARGDSMSPRVQNGEVLVVRADGLDISSVVGKQAVVKVKDGPYLFKTVRRGYEPNRFNLESFNAPLRENVEIEWIGELWAIIPASRWLRIP
jgi:phage repressor protein C with HTH and peptisase S24 domain